jgi:hypothetical protein
MTHSSIRAAVAATAGLLAVAVISACGGGNQPTTTDHVATVTRTVVRTVPGTTTPQTQTEKVTTLPDNNATTGTTVPPPNPSAPLTLARAEDALKRLGYTALTERDFDPDQTLRVLVGVRRSDPSGHAQQAFFFVGNRFIGTDTSDPSGSVSVTGQRAGEVTLTYNLYRPSDSLDGPSDGTADVTYRWTGSKLVPMGSIPTSSPQASGSRR